MNQAVMNALRADLQGLAAQGLYKTERVLERPAGRRGQAAGHEVINLCANNYLGLANHPAVRAAAQRSLDEYGYGMASVRFICGTQALHKELERRLAGFLGMEDVILYSSCFDANGGLFETLLDERDAVISDALNHASIIDGIRLCKAQRLRYANNDMAELEQCLKEAQPAPARASSPPTACSPWTASSRSCTESATWPSATTRWSWSMTRTPPASWEPRGRGTPEHCGVAAAHRHPHRHPRQGAGRRQRRLHRRAQ